MCQQRVGSRPFGIQISNNKNWRVTVKRFTRLKHLIEERFILILDIISTVGTTVPIYINNYNCFVLRDMYLNRLPSIVIHKGFFSFPPLLNLPCLGQAGNSSIGISS